MELYHFSEKEFTLDKNKKYILCEPIPMKPAGLWLSDESDYGWKAWCDNNDFGSLNHAYKCVINTDNILHITTVPQLMDFTKKYPPKPILGFESMAAILRDQIDWKRVMGEYDGIVITPYQWEVRSVLWYYPWDCASGCVWGLKAIESIQLV